MANMKSLEQMISVAIPCYNRSTLPKQAIDRCAEL